jgi:hypothetical protein
MSFQNICATTLSKHSLSKAIAQCSLLSITTSGSRNRGIWETPPPKSRGVETVSMVRVVHAAAAAPAVVCYCCCRQITSGRFSYQNEQVKEIERPQDNSGVDRLPPKYTNSIKHVRRVVRTCLVIVCSYNNAGVILVQMHAVECKDTGRSMRISHYRLGQEVMFECSRYLL